MILLSLKYVFRVLYTTLLDLAYLVPAVYPLWRSATCIESPDLHTLRTHKLACLEEIISL